MPDDKDFWKELLGDEYNEEVMKAIEDSEKDSESGGESGGGETPEPAAAADEPDEDADFAESFFEHYGKDASDDAPAAEPESARSAAPQPETAPEPVPAEEDDAPDLSQEQKKREFPEDTGAFDVDFDFEREYRAPKPKPLVRRSNVRKLGISGGLMYFIFILAISALIAGTGWLAATDVLGFSGSDEAVTVTVEKNFTVDTVTDMLYSNGLIKYKPLFKFYASFSHAADKISAGTYVLNKDYDYRALVNGMTSSGGTRVVVTVTIPEGYSLKQTIQLLDEYDVCNAEDLWDAAANYNFEYTFLNADTVGDSARLEGFLFPDTYDFYINDKPSRVLNKMLSNFSDKWTDEYQAKTDELGYTARDIVTIASLIEKEAGADSERADIASVIYNRLNSGMALQLDSTINYIADQTGQTFSTELDSPYNTYQHTGLPSGPICDPGTASIKAALNPSSTGYYYFGVDKDGATHFFADYESFSAFTASDQYGGQAH